MESAIRSIILQRKKLNTVSIKNNICESCVHNFLCKYKDFVQKFSEDSKEPMGIDIEILSCSSYDKDE
jgi:hypothetical protein